MVPSDPKVLYRLNPLLIDVLEAFAATTPTQFRAPDGRPYIDSSAVVDSFRKERGIDPTSVLEKLFQDYGLIAWSGKGEEPDIHYFTLTGAGEAMVAKIAEFRKQYATNPKFREAEDAKMRAAQPKYVTLPKPAEKAAGVKS